MPTSWYSDAKWKPKWETKLWDGSRNGSRSYEMGAEIGAEMVAEMWPKWMPKSILAKVRREGGQVSQKDVRDVFEERWFFSNKIRDGVKPRTSNKPHEAHGSDTFGLVRAHDGKWHLTQVTARYPDVVKLLTSWIEGQAYSKHVLAIIDALSKRCSVEIKARVRG
jgi:hypothetical protein